MYIYTLINVIVAIIVIIALVFLAFRFYSWRQGDEQITMLTKRRTQFEVEDINFHQVTLVCDIPFVNKGRQNGTIMDLYPRHLMPQEQFDNVWIQSWTTDANAERHDGYWKAQIIEAHKGGIVRLRLIFNAKNGNIHKDLAGFPDMNIDIVYQVVGRSDWHISKNRIVLTAEELQHALR
ncbi:hypothetical protein [uncultured Veillonella sp.]|uniref:hypothetical protein n=1 Tax=uncultured Veillonella sp. TaxID=159268 RepID=UPI0025EAE66A|nr:hypothetical protein [uncultured Veillonella sp.]MDY3974322.1 hypothetical protein [Veillonella caviae]